MLQATENVYALHQIKSLPIDLDNPFYLHYPALKLGVKEGIQYYALKLVPLITSLLNRDKNSVLQPTSSPYEWVLTSPAFNGIPSAANLLCWYLYDLLQEELSPSLNLSLIKIRERDRFSKSSSNQTTSAPSLPAQHSGKNWDYSQLTVGDRVKSRQQSHSFIIDEPSFQGKTVIFINDINVTGTQQRFLQQYFERLHAQKAYWFYVIDVESDIGKSEPKLEAQINYSQYADFDEFSQIIATANIQYTSKCLWRLFSYSLPELERLFNQLESSRKQAILNLVMSEDYFQSDHIRPKVELLHSYCFT